MNQPERIDPVAATLAIATILLAVVAFVLALEAR